MPVRWAPFGEVLEALHFQNAKLLLNNFVESFIRLAVEPSVTSKLAVLYNNKL
jgi:hypothetical protein